MPTQNYICPNCGGKGCPVCQNTGQLTLSDQEVAQLQKLATHTTQTQTQPYNDFGAGATTEHEERKLRGQVAGVFTLLFLAAIAVSGFASYFYTKTFKPFFQFWLIVITFAVLKPVSSLGFFREEKVHDFIGALQEEGIKIKLPPFYPLL